jgi:hypothetical protein
MQIEIVRVLILLRIKFLMSIVLWIWIVLRMTIIFEVLRRMSLIIWRRRWISHVINYGRSIIDWSC